MRSLGVLIALSVLTVASAGFINLNKFKKIITTDKIIRSHGYPAESHYVETPDGYVLHLFRIPYSHKLVNEAVKRPTVLLLHGMFSTSDCWLSTGPDYALGYLLADAGYDVWLGNARGNMYSRNNTKISPKRSKFWHFDWHEIGKIDIPAMIDFIIGRTGEEKIHYVGHSQGTTAYFVMMSERPEYNDKIKSAHMLAPCAFFEHSDFLALKAFRRLIGKPGSKTTRLLEDKEVFPKNTLIGTVSNTACGADPAFKIICSYMWKVFAANGYTNTNVTALQTLAGTHPGGLSSNQLIHYVQLSDHNKRRFCQMDYGAKRNRKVYGQERVPDYNLTNVRAYTYFYSSANDGICVQKDVDTLVANIPHLALDYRIPLQTFNHIDFILANNVKELLNDRIMENMAKHEHD